MRLAKSIRQDVRLAKSKWCDLNKPLLDSLVGALRRHRLSLAGGEVILIDGRWYVTHSGLLRVAMRKHCHGMRVQPVKQFCDTKSSRYAFRATVYTSPACKGFVGYGDADPSNVSPLVHGAEMRVAETRAVNRALRKAYGIGLCSVEELGSLPSRAELPTQKRDQSRLPQGNGSSNGHPRLRDQLCLLIRKHQLDAALVKLYAAEFCGTTALPEASREKVESFITHLADWAARDRDALLCKLNSYIQTQEASA
jgi:hypothetical protein